ncbi:protein Mpv17 [Trifolium pratense]|uniref:Protein Mpv17 n=1 Tax=Trifolium pratense TaxID=57577 RepID=A0A2K3P4E9_TRIPR|nr:protein Mpv17 [Trifolium pratense]
MMMSSACCNALTNNHLLLSRSVTLSPQPTALQFQSPSSLLLSPIRSPFNQLRFRHSRLSALSDDGSGGTGGTGGDGGSGGWNSGNNESDDGGGKWSFLSWYLALLAKYPVAVKALTSAILTLIGDLICQLVIDKVQTPDLKRTFLFTLLGIVLVGPTLHFWYLYLSKLVTLSGTSGALLRLVIDQVGPFCSSLDLDPITVTFLFAPIFIGVFLSSLVTLEGRPSQAVPKLKQEWFSAVLANWQLWIPFQFLNFRFVPQQFQIAANFHSSNSFELT